MSAADAAQLAGLRGRSESGLDVRVARALTGAWLRRDIRVGGGRLAFLASLIFVLGGVFSTCAFAAAKLVTSGSPRFVFASAGFLVAGGVIIVTLAGQFAGAVLDPRDIELLGPRPINATTYAVARVASCSLYTLLIGIPAHLPFAVLGLLVPGATLAFAPVYLAIAILACVGGTSALILGYMTLARALGIRKLHATLTFVQMLMSAAMWPLIPLVLQMGTPGPLYAIGDSVALVAAPPAWLGALVDVALGAREPRLLAMATLGAFSLLLFLAVLPRFLSLDYVRTAYSQLAGLSSRYQAPRTHRWEPSLRAGFDLALWSIRDPRLIARLAPGLVMPFLYGFAIMVPFGNIDPYAPGSMPFGIVPAAMLAMMPPGFLIALQRSDRWRAGFIFEVAPLENPARVVLGVELAAGLLYLVPAGALVLWAAARWPPASAGLFALDLVAALGVTLATTPLFVERLPFCRPFEATTGMREQVSMIIGMALPLSTAFVVRAVTARSLTAHALVDVAVFGTGALVHSQMLRSLNRRLLAGFGRGHAAQLDVEPRWTSRALGLGFGLASVFVGCVCLAAPIAWDVKDLEPGAGFSVARLRGVGARRSAYVALQDDDPVSADRLVKLAAIDDPGLPAIRAEAAVAARIEDAQRLDRARFVLAARNPRSTEVRLLQAQVEVLSGRCPDPSGAGAEDDDLLKLSRTVVRAYHDRAVQYARCGKLDYARDMLSQLVAVDPGNDSARQNLKRAAAGDTHLRFWTAPPSSLLPEVPGVPVETSSSLFRRLWPRQP